ncbi:hypothetical protein AAH994_07075 [Weeksellaceae bacterium A-14]
MMIFLLFILFILLSLSLLLIIARKGKFRKLAFAFRMGSVILGIALFTYWFVEKSIDQYLKNSIALQLINELPQPIDFYIIKLEKRSEDTRMLTEHLGKIRTDHFRLEYLKMAYSDEYWVAGYIGKNMVYFSDHYVPNKNMDQIVNVNNYVDMNENLSEKAKILVDEYKNQNKGIAVWITMDLLLIFLNIGMLIRKR